MSGTNFDFLHIFLKRPHPMTDTFIYKTKGNVIGLCILIYVFSGSIKENKIFCTKRKQAFALNFFVHTTYICQCHTRILEFVAFLKNFLVVFALRLCPVFCDETATHIRHFQCLILDQPFLNFLSSVPA